MKKFARLRWWLWIGAVIVSFATLNLPPVDADGPDYAGLVIDFGGAHSKRVVYLSAVPSAEWRRSDSTFRCRRPSAEASCARSMIQVALEVTHLAGVNATTLTKTADSGATGTGMAGGGNSRTQVRRYTRLDMVM